VEPAEAGHAKRPQNEVHMARPHAFRVSTFLVTGAALAFALPAAADNRSPAPIVYKGAGQGSAQGGIPQADFSAVQDQWRGPVTNTGSASLPAQRERIAFSYPGSSSAPADIAPLRQMASVESEPLAALPDTSTDRMWPAQMDQQTRTPIAPRTLTLGGAEQKAVAAIGMGAAVAALAIFRRVGGEFVQRQTERLHGIGRKLDVRTLDDHAVADLRRVVAELPVDDVAQARAAPVARNQHRLFHQTLHVHLR